MVDTLVGLKENVILGHLIPAGTAFAPHQQLRIKHLAEPPAPAETTPEVAPSMKAFTMPDAVPQAGS
jgi:DNA-directed RNA polymerase subunit beta'